MKITKISEETNKMTLWVVLFVLVGGALIGPLELQASEQHKSLASVMPNATMINTTTSITSTASIKNSTATAAATTALESKPPAIVHKVNSRLARSPQPQASGGSLSILSSSPKSMKSFGDTIGLETALDSHWDLTPAAGEHGKKYILVKKKPKHKKIKMEVYKPKMKYKKIKMKVPVKKMKKKKVKGYLVKKHKHHY